ncbi:Uncharacterized protein PKNOH_S05393500 [Plasmodium knowlesi]|uniref:ubiquitinyl hydrolase 1 n=1 Tax=Plasmodium knowlesi TaxID=5850 RepID=A0A1Y3DW28_PLAKN|nr:Uncharacterized protein PKNOH_S05393500 [Plasmodium knowlesi]
MSNYIWNNTYSLEFLSEDFYDLNISTKDNVYEVVRRRKDDNEVESLSINISNHICMFVQLLDNLLGKISYNNSTINDTLNYKKLSDIFHFVKNQLYNCDYSLFLRIYSIYHTYNHRKNGYLDVNNLYTFILDIINKIENLNDNNFLILPGGFYLQKEKMLIKILYIIHKQNNMYSFTVLNNSIYGIQYHPFKIDQVDNLGVLLRDVTLCIKNISKNFLTNSLFWLCLYRLYIFPNPDNVDILYQVLLPYLNNSFLTNNWNLKNNKTVRVSHMGGSDVGHVSSSGVDTLNVNPYGDALGRTGNSPNSQNLLSGTYNYGNNLSYRSMNHTGGNFRGYEQATKFNDPSQVPKLINLDHVGSGSGDLQSGNKFKTYENSPPQKSDYFSAFDFIDNVSRREEEKHIYVGGGMGNEKSANQSEKYGGIYVNIYKNKFTSFSMSLYYCIIYILKVLNIPEEDVEVFKIFLYYSIVLKLCDDLFVYESAEKNRLDGSNAKFMGTGKENIFSNRSDKKEEASFFGNNMSSYPGDGISSTMDINHLSGNYERGGDGQHMYLQNDGNMPKSNIYGKIEIKKDPNKIDSTFFVFLDMSIRKLCILFHQYFCKMKMGIYDKNKMIKNEILNEILKKVLFVKYMYTKVESRFYADVTITGGGEIMKGKDYKNSIKFPMEILLQEHMYKNYRKIEIKKDVNIPISFYISRRTIHTLDDLYVILYQTNIITNILINQKNYIKHCYLLAFSFLSHVLNNILPSPKHFIYLSQFQKLKRSLQISLFQEIYHMHNNIYFISSSIVQNKQIVMYKIVNSSMLLFLYDFLLRIPCVDVCSPFAVHYNGFSTGRGSYLVHPRGGIDVGSSESESAERRGGRRNGGSHYQMIKQFSRNVADNDSYSSLDECAHADSGAGIQLSGYCIDISVLECFSNYFLIINPKLNIMRSDIIEYFYKINEKKINKNSELFLFEKSNDINTSEIEILENISLDLGLDRKKNHIIEYYCGQNILFKQLIPEFYHLRDMLFLFKSYMCPYIDKLPPVRVYKYDDINLKFSYKNKLHVSVFNREIDICGYMCPPKDTKLNFFSFLYQFMQSQESKKDNCILTYSNPNMYTSTYIENELDVLYVNDLPFFHPSLNLRDVEILLQYLTVPYIRIPLILEFFCDKNRIKSFQSFDIQQLLLCTLFEPYIFKNKYKVTEEDNYIPTKDRNIFATKYGLLLNELIMSPKNVLCSIYSYLEFFFSFDKENSSSGKLIMVFIVMLCTYVNSYIGLLVETNREIRRNLRNIENIISKEGLVHGGKRTEGEVAPGAEKHKSGETGRAKRNRRRKKRKLHFFNKLRKKLIKNELYCSDDVFSNLDTYYRKIKRKLEDEVIDVLLKYARLCIQKNDITTCCIYHGCILLIYKDIKFRELNRNNVKNLLSSIFFILTYYTFNAETNYADLKNIYGLGSLFVNTTDSLSGGGMEFSHVGRNKDKGIANPMEFAGSDGDPSSDSFSLLIKTFSLCECDIFISIHRHRNMLLKYLERNEMERNIIFEHTIHVCACVHENNKNEYTSGGRLNRYNSNIFLNFRANENIIRKWMPAHKFKHVGIYTIENVKHGRGNRGEDEEKGEVWQGKGRRHGGKMATSNYFFTSSDSSSSLAITSSSCSADLSGSSISYNSSMSSYDDDFSSTEEDESDECEKAGEVANGSVQKSQQGDAAASMEREAESLPFDEIANRKQDGEDKNGGLSGEKGKIGTDQQNRAKSRRKTRKEPNEKEEVDKEAEKINQLKRKKRKKKKKQKKQIKMMQRRRRDFLDNQDDESYKDGTIRNPLHDTESLPSNSINPILNLPSFLKITNRNITASSEKRKLRMQRARARAKAKRDSILSNNKYISYIKKIVKEKNILINLQLFTFSYKDNNIITLNDNIKKFKNYRDVFFNNKNTYLRNEKRKRAHHSSRIKKKNVKVLITQSYQNFCSFNIIGKKHNLEVWKISNKINLKNLMKYKYDKSKIFYIKSGSLLSGMKFSPTKTGQVSSENASGDNLNMTCFYNFLSSEVKTGVLYEQENNDMYVRIIWKFKKSDMCRPNGDNNTKGIRISAEDVKGKDNNALGGSDDYGARKDKELLELKSFNINYETQNIEGLFNFKYEENQYDSSLINTTEESSFSDDTRIVSNGYDLEGHPGGDNGEKASTRLMPSSTSSSDASSGRSSGGSSLAGGDLAILGAGNEPNGRTKGRSNKEGKKGNYKESAGGNLIKSGVTNLEGKKENKKKNESHVDKEAKEEEEHGLREIIYRKDMNCIYIYNIYFKLNRFVKKLYYCSDVKKVYFSTSINRCKNLFYNFENNNVRLCYYNSKETYDKYSVSISRNLYNNIQVQTYLNPVHLSTFVPNILLQYYNFWYNSDGSIIGEIKSLKKNRKNRNSIIYIRLFEGGRGEGLVSSEEASKKSKCLNFVKKGLHIQGEESKHILSTHHYGVVQKLQIFNSPKDSNRITSLRVNNDYRAMTLINILSYENNEVYRDFYNLLMKFDHITYILIYTLSVPSLFGGTSEHVDVSSMPITVDLIEIPRLNLTLRRNNVDLRMGVSEKDDPSENQGVLSSTATKKDSYKYHFEELNMHLYTGNLQKYNYIYNVIKKMNNTVLLQNSKSDFFFLVSLLNKPFFLNIANLYKEFNKKNIHLCTLLEKHINILLKNHMYVTIYYHNFNINMNVNKNVDVLNENAETNTASSLQYIVLSIHSSKLFINFRNIYSCFFFIVYKYIQKEHEEVVEYCNNLSVCKDDIKEIKYLLNILNYCDSSIFSDVDSCACRLKIFITLSKQIKIILRKKRHRMGTRKDMWNMDQYYNIFHYVKSLWNFDKSGPNDNNSSSGNEGYNSGFDANHYTTSRGANRRGSKSGNGALQGRDTKNGRRKNQVNDTMNKSEDSSSVYGASENSSSYDSNYVSSEKENKKKELNAQEKIIDGDDDDLNGKKKNIKKKTDFNKKKSVTGRRGESQQHSGQKNDQHKSNNAPYEENQNMHIYIYWDIIKDMQFYINNLIYIKAKCKLTIDEEIFLYQNCNINIHKYKLIYNRYIILNSILESKMTSDKCNPLFFYNILRKKQLENQAKMRKYQIQYRKKSKIDELHPTKKLEMNLASPEYSLTYNQNGYDMGKKKIQPSMEGKSHFENVRSNFESLKNCLGGKKEKQTKDNNLVVSINVPKVEAVKYINNIDENIFMNINLYDNIGNIINNMSYKKMEDKNNVEALNYLNSLINSLGIQNFFIIYNYFINNLNVKIIKGENTFLYGNLLSRYLYFYNYNISQYSKIIYIFIFIINHQEIVNMLPKIDDQKMKKNYLNFFKANDSVFNFFNDIFKFVQNFQKDRKKKIKKNILPLMVDNNLSISISDVIKYRLIININVDDYMCEKRVIQPFDVKPNVHVSSDLLNELCFSPFKKLYKYLRRVKRTEEPTIHAIEAPSQVVSDRREVDPRWDMSPLLKQPKHLTTDRKNMLNFDFEESNISCQNTYSKNFIQNMKNDYNAYLDYQRKKVEYEFVGFSAEEIKMTFNNIKKLKEYVNMFVSIKDILLEIFVGDNKLLECINEFIEGADEDIIGSGSHSDDDDSDNDTGNGNGRDGGMTADKEAFSEENTPWNEDLVDIDLHNEQDQANNRKKGAQDKQATSYFMYKFGVLGKAEKEINLKILIRCFMSKYAHEYLAMINPNLKKKNAKKFINIVLLYMLIMNRKIFLHECISSVINILNIFKVYNLKLKILKQKEKSVRGNDSAVPNVENGTDTLLSKLLNRQQKIINKAINTIQLGTKNLTQLTLTERHYFTMRNKSSHKKIVHKNLDYNSDSSDVSTCYFSSDQYEEGQRNDPVKKEENGAKKFLNSLDRQMIDPLFLGLHQDEPHEDRVKSGDNVNSGESTNCYYTYDPRLLIFEYTNNLIIRKKQVKMIKKFKRDFIKKKKQYCYQIIMGGGKTTVLSPLYFLIFSNYFLVFNMCPHPLIHFTINTFRSRFSSIIKKNIYYFNFSRYDNITTDLYVSLCTALENKYILVTSPTCIKSLFLKLVNTIQELNNMKTFDMIKQKAKTHITDALTKFLGFQNDENSFNAGNSSGLKKASTSISGHASKSAQPPTTSDYNMLKKQLDLSVRIFDILNKSILLIDEIDNVLHPLKSELHWPYGTNREIDLVNVVRNFTDVFMNNPYLKFLYDNKNDDVDIRSVKIAVANRREVSANLLNHIRQLREEEQAQRQLQRQLQFEGGNDEDDDVRKVAQHINYGGTGGSNSYHVDHPRTDNRMRLKNGAINNFNNSLSTHLYRKEDAGDYGGVHGNMADVAISGSGLGLVMNETNRYGSVKMPNSAETGTSYTYIDLSLFRYKLSWVLIDFFFYPVYKKLTIPMNIHFNTNTEYIEDLLNTFSKEIEKGIRNHDISLIPHFHIINFKWYDNIIWIIARYVYYFLLCYKISGVSQKVIESYLCIPLCIGYNDINVKNRCKDNNFSSSTIRRLLNIKKFSNKNYSTDASNLRNEDMHVLSSDYHFKIFEKINTLDYILCKILNLCRLYINGILPFVFSKVNTVHYGILSAEQINRCQMIMSKSRYFLAVPYIGKDTPSEMSEFTNVDVVVSLTILSYRYQGMRYFDFILSMKNILYNYSLEKDYEHVQSESSEGSVTDGESSSVVLSDSHEGKNSDEGGTSDERSASDDVLAEKTDGYGNSSGDQAGDGSSSKRSSLMDTDKSSNGEMSTDKWSGKKSKEKARKSHKGLVKEKRTGEQMNINAKKTGEEIKRSTKQTKRELKNMYDLYREVIETSGAKIRKTKKDINNTNFFIYDNNINKRREHSKRTKLGKNYVDNIDRIDLGDKEMLYDLYNLTRKNPLLISYFLLGIILNKYIKHTEKQLSSNSQDLTNNVLFKYVVGYSGTSNDILPEEIHKCKFEKRTIGSILNIINDPKIVNFIFLPSQIAPIDILRSLSFSKIKFNSLIDTGYLINNISPKKVAYYILQFLDYIDCCVYIDNGKHMCMLPLERKRRGRRKKKKKNRNKVLMQCQEKGENAKIHSGPHTGKTTPRTNETRKNTKSTMKRRRKKNTSSNKQSGNKIENNLHLNVEIIPLQDCYVPIKKRFIYFDHINTFGQDIKQYVNANSLVTVNIGNDISSFSQGVFRLRSIGMNQKIFFLIPMCLVKLMNISTSLFKDTVLAEIVKGKSVGVRIEGGGGHSNHCSQERVNPSSHDEKEMLKRFVKRKKRVMRECNKNYSEGSQTESDNGIGEATMILSSSSGESASSIDSVGNNQSGHGKKSSSIDEININDHGNVHQVDDIDGVPFGGYEEKEDPRHVMDPREECMYMIDCYNSIHLGQKSKEEVLKELTYYLILNNISNNIKQCELLCVHGIVNIIKRKSIKMLLDNYINIGVFNYRDYLDIFNTSIDFDVQTQVPSKSSSLLCIVQLIEKFQNIFTKEDELFLQDIIYRYFCLHYDISNKTIVMYFDAFFPRKDFMKTNLPHVILDLFEKLKKIKKDQCVLSYKKNFTKRNTSNEYNAEDDNSIDNHLFKDEYKLYRWTMDDINSDLFGAKTKKKKADQTKGEQATGGTISYINNKVVEKFNRLTEDSHLFIPLNKLPVNDIYLNFPSYVYVSKNFTNLDSINTKKGKKIMNVLVVIECVHNAEEQVTHLNQQKHNNYDEYAEKEALENIWNILKEDNIQEILNILDINPFKYSYDLAKIMTDHVKQNEFDGNRFASFVSLLNRMELYFSNKNKKYIIVSLQEAETLRYYMHKKFNRQKVAMALSGRFSYLTKTDSFYLLSKGDPKKNANLVLESGANNAQVEEKGPDLNHKIENLMEEEMFQENLISDGWGLNNNLSSIALEEKDEGGDMDHFFMEEIKKKEVEKNKNVSDTNNWEITVWGADKEEENVEMLSIYEKEKMEIDPVKEENFFSDVHINLYNYHFWFTPIEITDRNNLRKYISRQIQIVYSVCKFFNSDRKFIDAHVNLLLQYLNFNAPKHRFSYFNDLYLQRRIMKDSLTKSNLKMPEKKSLLIKKNIELEMVEKKLFEGNGDIYAFKIMQQTVRQSLKKKQLTLQEIFDKDDLDYICSKQDIRILFDFLNIRDSNYVNVLFDILGSTISLHELCFTLNPVENMKKTEFQKDLYIEDKKRYAEEFFSEAEKYLKNFRFSLTEHTYFKVIWSGRISSQRIVQESLEGREGGTFGVEKKAPFGQEVSEYALGASLGGVSLGGASLGVGANRNAPPSERDPIHKSPSNDLLSDIFGFNRSQRNDEAAIYAEQINHPVKNSEQFYIYEAENIDPKDRGMMSKNKHKIIFGHYASSKPADNNFPILEMTDISINSMYTSASAQEILNLLFPYPKKYLLLWHEDYSIKSVDECLHIWKPVLSSTHMSGTTFLGFVATVGPHQPPLNKIRALPKSLVKVVQNKKFATFYSDNSFSIDNSGLLNSLNVHFFSKYHIPNHSSYSNSAHSNSAVQCSALPLSLFHDRSSHFLLSTFAAPHTSPLLDGLDFKNYEEFLFRNFSLNIVAKVKKIKSVNEDIFNLWGEEKQQEQEDDEETSPEWEIIPQCL